MTDPSLTTDQLRTLAHLLAALQAQAGRQCPAPPQVLSAWATTLRHVLRQLPPGAWTACGLEPEDLP